MRTRKVSILFFVLVTVCLAVGSTLANDTTVFESVSHRSALTAPTLTVTTSGTTVSLSWTSVAGATRYTLYYAPFPYTGPGSIKNIPMGTRTSMSATLWDSAAFYVAVQAYDSVESSGYSNIEYFIIDSSISVVPASLSLSIGGTGTCTMSGGTSPYSASSSNTSVATVSVNANTLSVTGVSAGSATITVSDSGSDSTTVSVTITGGRIYYVSTQGNNQFDGLTEATAFSTLGHAIEVVRPGESIHILSGTYHEALMLQNIGSAEAIISIRGLGTKPIFDGQRSGTIGFWCEKCENLLFDNLEFTNYSDIGIGVYLSTGVTMQNLKVHNNGFAPQLVGWEIEGYGIDVDTSQHATIKNNQVYRNGPDPRPFGTLGTGINTFKCTDCVIQDNSSYENIGGGMLVEDGVNVLVEGNEIRANYLDATEDEWWDGGLWVDGGHDIIVRNNLFANNIGPGIQISDEELQKPYGYVLENNVCTGNYYGIFIWNLSKDDTWPDESILSRSGNQFSENTVKDIWIVESY